MPVNNKNNSSLPSRSRLAVCLCNCGHSLAERLDFSALATHAGQLPGVARVLRCSKLCQPGGFDELFEAMSTQRISRALIAACAPAYYQPPLDQALTTAGTNPHLISKLNIREHCAWVHPHKIQATAKAQRLIDASVQRLHLAERVNSQRLALNRQVLIIGAGLTGMRAALSLAANKHKVTLIEKSDQLGGTALEQSAIPEAAATAARLAADVQANRRITVLTVTVLRSLTGRFGQFQGRLCERKIECGAVIVATGQSQLPGPEQLPELTGILTFDDLARSLQANRLSNLQRIGLLLDLHSQQDRAATRSALRLARRLRQRWSCEVYLFCQHLRLAGADQEQEYQQARQAGVVIIKSLSAPDISQEVTAVRLKGSDEQTGRDFDLLLDLLAVADLPVTNNGQDRLTRSLHIGRPIAGLVQQDNVFLLPVDSGRKGIIFAGSCRASLEWQQALADGLTAAAWAHALLPASSTRSPAKRAEVNPAACAFCLTCYRSCPHGAINMDRESRAAIVEPVMCQACGVCVAECPAQAIDLIDYTDAQLVITPASEGTTIVFACENSALLAADRAGLCRLEYSSQVHIVPLPCAGRVDPVHVLRALQKGACKVLVLGCHHQACKYLHGFSRARARLRRLQTQLNELGLEPDCVQIGSLMAADAGSFVDFVNGGLAKVCG